MDKLYMLSYLDSDQMAAYRQQELNIPRYVAAGLEVLQWKLLKQGTMSHRPARRCFGVMQCKHPVPPS